MKHRNPTEAQKGKVCVLVSGGVDSCVLLGVMAQQFHEVFPVYIRCGLRWEKAEIHWLKKYLKVLSRKGDTGQRGVLRPLVVLDMPAQDLYGSHWSVREKDQRSPGTARSSRSQNRVPGRNSEDREVYLPGRNLFLLVKASVFCSRRGIHTIAMGQLKGNPFPDATRKFLRSAEKALSLGLHTRLRVLTPFLDSCKCGVVERGRALGLPLELSFSCLAPGPRFEPCGQCNKCAERDRVLIE